VKFAHPQNTLQNADASPAVAARGYVGFNLPVDQLVELDRARAQLHIPIADPTAGGEQISTAPRSCGC
jgi:hypothetical protein